MMEIKEKQFFCCEDDSGYPSVSVWVRDGKVVRVSYDDVPPNTVRDRCSEEVLKISLYFMILNDMDVFRDLMKEIKENEPKVYEVGERLLKEHREKLIKQYTL